MIFTSNSFKIFFFSVAYEYSHFHYDFFVMLILKIQFCDREFCLRELIHSAFISNYKRAIKGHIDWNDSTQAISVSCLHLMFFHCSRLELHMNYLQFMFKVGSERVMLNFVLQKNFIQKNSTENGACREALSLRLIETFSER